MDSGSVGGEFLREKQKWAESNKVYTRKNTNKSKNTSSVPQQSSQTLATAADDNNSWPPPVVSRFDAVASDNSSSQNRVQPNGIPGPTKFDNQINSRTKIEIRALKRKLANDLDQVRSLVKRLEAKEVQLSGYSGAGSHTHSQFSASEVVDKVGSAMRVNSEVGSVGPPSSRPFQGLSLSVAENNHGVGAESLEKEKRTPKVNKYYRNSDFVTGKEKLPPLESKKKLKSSAGKREGGEMGFGFGLDKCSSQLFKSCGNLLAKLMKHKHGWVFNAPVDVKGLGLRDYYKIIKHPMDLGTVKSRLSKNWYKSPREFAEDVRLTFSNAMLYNPKEQDAHIMAEQLSNIFQEKWAIIEAEYNLNRFEMDPDMGLPTPTSRRAPATLPRPPPSRTLERSESMTMPVDPKLKTMNLANPGRTPVPKKPKAKDPNKRDMTYEEKQRLSLNLQNLPSEKLDNIVQIIKKRNLGLLQQDDEIEVDIDTVDPETLWELDRFVTNYKKSLSQNKRKAELGLQASAEAGHNIRETDLAPTIAQGPKETEAAVEKIVASTSHAQRKKKGDDVSGSCSSSSSSSDSGSSSSDSDSDSSSGCGSDADHSPGS